MTILYTPREMLAMVEQKPAPDNFLRGKFVRGEFYSDKTQLEIDKVIGTQAIAQYSSRTGGPGVVDKTGYSTLLHVAPYIYEQIPFTSQDVDVRAPGETIYGANAGQSLAKKTSDWMMKLEERINRREEQQMASALISGTVVVSGAGVSYTVDYGMPAAQKITLTAGDVWGTTTSIIPQLTAWATLLSNRGYIATDLIMDPATAALLCNDTTVKAVLNNWRINMGQIQPQVVAGQRASYIGNLGSIGFNLDLWSYAGVYETSTGSYTNYLGADRAIMVASPSIDCRAHYGKIENLKQGNFIGKRFPNMWIEEDGRKGFITLESAPLIAIHNPECVVSVQVK